MATNDPNRPYTDNPDTGRSGRDTSAWWWVLIAVIIALIVWWAVAASNRGANMQARNSTPQTQGPIARNPGGGTGSTTPSTTDGNMNNSMNTEPNMGNGRYRTTEPNTGGSATNNQARGSSSSGGY